MVVWKIGGLTDTGFRFMLYRDKRVSLLLLSSYCFRLYGITRSSVIPLICVASPFISCRNSANCFLAFSISRKNCSRCSVSEGDDPECRRGVEWEAAVFYSAQKWVSIRSCRLSSYLCLKLLVNGATIPVVVSRVWKEKSLATYPYAPS